MHTKKVREIGKHGGQLNVNVAELPSRIIGGNSMVGAAGLGETGLENISLREVLETKYAISIEVKGTKNKP